MASSGSTLCARPGIGDGAGHSPDRAGGLVLGQHAAALFANDAAADQSVGAHAGEHHGQHAGAVDRGRGAKQHIDGGAAVILQRALVQVQRGRRAGRAAASTSMCQLPRAM